MIAAIFFLFILSCSTIIASAPAGSIVVFERGEGGYYCHKIPYIQQTTSGALLAFAEARGAYGRESCDDYSGTDLVFKRSEDGGESWSELQVLYSNSSSSVSNVIGNAAPVLDESTGIIWVPFCRNNEEVLLTHSVDEGKTWAQPKPLQGVVSPDWKWVGLGPPAGLQLKSGRLLIPSYHTTAYKGDGELSEGHTMYSDDGGATWHIGASTFGSPFKSNECQAVQLTNGSVLINARVLLNRRIQVISNDGGLTFGDSAIANGLTETVEGCEGSIIGGDNGVLYYSGVSNNKLIRRGMQIYQSLDQGGSWQPIEVVDRGATAYSALTLLPGKKTDSSRQVGILYERADSLKLVFDPDQIVFWRTNNPAR
jgi:sialidase-1